MRRIIISGIASAFLLFAGALPAHANVVADPIVSPNLAGGCISEFAGTGSSVNIVVEAAVTAPAGALSLSVTCHLTQGTRHADFGAIGVGGVAAGGGAVTGWSLASYTLCTEVHASFLTGPPYHKYC